MPRRGERDPERERFWRRTIKAWGKSGQSLRGKFQRGSGKRRGLAETTFDSVNKAEAGLAALTSSAAATSTARRSAASRVPGRHRSGTARRRRPHRSFRCRWRRPIRRRWRSNGTGRRSACTARSTWSPSRASSRHWGERRAEAAGIDADLPLRRGRGHAPLVRRSRVHDARS